MKLLTAAQVRELDRQAIEDLGMPGVVLMENAGRGAAEVLHRRYAELFPGPLLILAGKGNNGGDGFVMARHLANWGWRVQTLVLATAEAVTGDAAINLAVLRHSDGDVIFVPDEETLNAALAAAGGSRLLVDALFGTGLSSKVRGVYARAIEWVNGSGLPVLAVDISSGVDATSGRVLGAAIRADLTVTFVCLKIGQVVYPGVGCGGHLEVVDIGMPATVLADAPDSLALIDRAMAVALAPARPPTGHKGTFGHLLVVAGSVGKIGAAALTAEGGLRMGCGLVTLASPFSCQQVLAVKLTEIMTAGLDELEGTLSLRALDQIRSLWAGKQALAIGPGLGQAEETVALVRRLVHGCPVPLVIDADGLNALGSRPEWLRQCADLRAVLTPHPGEMARLTGTSVAEVEADRIGVARRFASDYGVTLVLKGARTLIAGADGRIWVNPSGNPGMASGGMGDALTGMIAGLLAQGLAPQEAAVLGVYLHGLAADRLAKHCGNAGLFASDLLRELPAARNSLFFQGETHADS
ncbi:MAG: NAD(P)H-hydrate dehydratase [Desulfuromonadaceae bacterium]